MRRKGEGDWRGREIGGGRRLKERNGKREEGRGGERR